MKIEKCQHRVKCDFAGCNNYADYSLSTKGLLRRELCLCEECLKGIYEEVAKTQIPKGITSPFKEKDRLKKKSN